MLSSYTSWIVAAEGVVRLPHSTVSMLSEINRRFKFKKRYLQVRLSQVMTVMLPLSHVEQLSKQYATTLAKLRKEETELRTRFNERHDRVLERLPVREHLYDYPHTCIVESRPFDVELPSLSDSVVQEAADALYASAGDSPYADALRNLSPLPAPAELTFNEVMAASGSRAEEGNSVSSSRQGGLQGGLEDEEAKEDTSKVRELEAYISELHFEILALHAECALGARHVPRSTSATHVHVHDANNDNGEEEEEQKQALAEAEQAATIRDAQEMVRLHEMTKQQEEQIAILQEELLGMTGRLSASEEEVAHMATAIEAREVCLQGSMTSYGVMMVLESDA